MDDEVDERILAMLAKPEGADLDEVRALLRAETQVRRLEGDGCGDTLYALCFLLYLIGDADDVLHIHDAKHVNFDAGCMIDHDFYQMRRTRDEMLAIARGNARLEQRVNGAFDQPNYPTFEARVAALRAYFGVAAPTNP